MSFQPGQGGGPELQQRGGSGPCLPEGGGERANGSECWLGEMEERGSGGPWRGGPAATSTLPLKTEGVSLTLRRNWSDFRILQKRRLFLIE
jgi:hypothetical protein